MRRATLSSPAESARGSGTITDTSVTSEEGLLGTAAGAAATCSGTAVTTPAGSGVYAAETETSAVWGGPGACKGISLCAPFPDAGATPESRQDFSSTSSDVWP